MSGKKIGRCYVAPFEFDAAVGVARRKAGVGHTVTRGIANLVDGARTRVVARFIDADGRSDTLIGGLVAVAPCTLGSERAAIHLAACSSANSIRTICCDVARITFFEAGCAKLAFRVGGTGDLIRDVGANASRGIRTSGYSADFQPVAE